MITFTVNTVGVLIWILMVSILVPIICVVFLVVLMACLHIFQYCEVKIQDTYNNAVAKLKAKETKVWKNQS